MKAKLLRDTLNESLLAYDSLLLDAGLPFRQLSDRELGELSVSDIEKLIKQRQQLLRTPRD